MTILTVEIADKKANLVKQLLEELGAKVVVAKEESPYNPEFVEKVLESKQQVKNGKVTRVKKEDLKEFLGL